MSEQTFKLSNFRREANIEDWPLGSGRTGTAVFTHETKAKRGQRIGRMTPYRGRMSKPKYSTYYDRICLVDGDDGKTHYIGLSHGWLFVSSCNMMHSDFAIQPTDENYDEYRALLLAASEKQEVA